MKKYLHIDMVTGITLIVVFFCTYTLLLQDNFLHTSISSIIIKARHLELKPHLIVLGFLPIYISVVIFGSVLLGIYLSSIIKYALNFSIKKFSFVQRKQC